MILLLDPIIGVGIRCNHPFISLIFWYTSKHYSNYSCPYITSGLVHLPFAGECSEGLGLRQFKVQIMSF